MAEVKNLEECMNKNGVRWEKPVYTIDKLAMPATPHLRMTYPGYVNLKDRKILSVKV